MTQKLVFATGLPDDDVFKVRLIALVVSSCSIASCFVFVYVFFMIHPSRRVFRHYLIAQLVFFDFLKALSVLVHTSKNFHASKTAQSSVALIDGLGWMTVFGMEGSDATIFFFAVHMALLIFYKEVRTLKQKFTAPDWMIQHVKFTQWYNYNTSPNSKSTTASGSGKDSGSDFTHIDESNQVVPTPSSHDNTIVQPSEGALHRHQFTVIFISVLFPILVASISFSVHDAYQGYIYFIFFRVYTGPWYFTWIVRHVIDLCIIVIYISIYVYVLMQFKKVSNSFRKRRHGGNWSRSQSRSRVHEGTSSIDEEEEEEEDDDDDDGNDEESENALMNTFGDSMWYKIFKMFSMLLFPDVKIAAKLYGQSLDTEEDMVNIRQLKNEKTVMEMIQRDSVSTNEILGLDSTTASGTANNASKINKTKISRQIQNLMYEEAMDRFKARKAQILNQMKIIFIYPISYLLIWLFPMINHYQIVRHQSEATWSTVAAAICQPLNGFVDTIVFIIREKPWQLATPADTVLEKPMLLAHDSLNMPVSGYARHGWRYYVSWLPGYYNYGDISEDIMYESVGRVEQAEPTYGRSGSADASMVGSGYRFERQRNVSVATTMTSSGADDVRSSAAGSSFNHEELDLKEFLSAGPLAHGAMNSSRRTTLPTTVITKPKPAIVVPRAAEKRQSLASWRTRSSVTSSNMSAGQQHLRSQLSKEQLSREQLSREHMSRGDDSRSNRVEWNLNVFDRRDSGSGSRSGSVSGSGDSGEDDKMDIIDFLNSRTR